ncbi:hypothetical protein FACS1894151_04780 [Spirochaetia bacterium]|nr:hypothetical protein FACS1894151_04780 [Spirochaetia bacterium]
MKMVKLTLRSFCKERYTFIMRYSFFALLAALCVLASCASGPVEIADNLSPEELIQRAQEASDNNNYNRALRYYEALRDRYSDIEQKKYLCTAEYEIAFIYYKQKKYEEATEGFMLLLERYEGEDAIWLPRQYRVLANIVLENIQSKQKS